MNEHNVTTVLANSLGHTLYRWTDIAGTGWACAAADHGPFCRLCRPVDDDIHRALLDLVASGELEVRTRPDGQMEFKTTGAGDQRAGELLRELTGGDPDD